MEQDMKSVTITCWENKSQTIIASKTLIGRESRLVDAAFEKFLQIMGQYGKQEWADAFRSTYQNERAMFELTFNYHTEEIDFSFVWSDVETVV